MTRFTSHLPKSMFALLIACGTLATNLQAQNDSVTATVPFPFTVGTQCNAPGTYRFSLMSSQYVLTVLNVNTGDKRIFDVHPEHQPTSEERGLLMFRNSEGPKTLNEIHFPGSDAFSALAEPRHAGRTETSSSAKSKSVCMVQH